MSRALSPSSLIDVALRTAEKPGVAVEVTHLLPTGAVPPLPAGPDVAAAWSTRTPGTWPLGEAFTSFGPTTAMHLRTRRVARANRSGAGTGATEISPHTDGVEADWRRTSWLGVSPGDPDFLFDFADKLDVLLTLAPDGWHPSPAQSLLLTDALVEATTSAGVRAALPVTFVRSPSAGFSAGQLALPVDGDDPLLARGATLRLTVGLDRADEGARIELLQSLTSYARGMGYGLRVADRRYGSISGKWIVLQRLDPAVLVTAVEAAARRALAQGRRPDDAAALLTVIGPSRLGSFAAVAAALSAAGVTVRAVTCLSSQDLGFVHAECNVGSGTAGGLASLLAAEGGGPTDPVDLFALVRALAPGSPDPAGRPDLHAARGYQCLLSGPYRPVAGASTRVPVWASWEVRDAPAGLSETGTAQALLDRLRSHDLLAEVRVEYRRFRRRSLDRIAERVKLAVALRPDEAGGGDSDERVAEMCLGMQQAMRVPGAWQPPAGDPAVTPRLVSFRVSPKERWLGTWLDDPR